MITTVNPGSSLELVGSFELRPNFGRTNVVDRESGQAVDLGSLLRSFLEDPDETVTGPVQISITPLRQRGPW